MPRLTVAEAKSLLFTLRQEKLIATALLAIATDVREASTKKEIEDFLDEGDVYAALEVVNNHIGLKATAIITAFILAGNYEVDLLRRQVGAAKFAFDATESAASALIQQHKLTLVTSLVASQRMATQLALSNSVFGRDDRAKIFFDSIGLSPRQVQATANYRKLLEGGDKAALARRLRDPRFDGKLATALAEGRRLSDKQIDTMVNRYRVNQVRHRMGAIGKATALTATSLAKDEATRQFIDATNTPESSVERTWEVVNDDVLRDHHATMDGQTVGLNEVFIDGLGNELRFPGDPSAPIETTINCRCSIKTKIKTKTS